MWREMREAEEDRTSKHRLTGQQELSTKPDWQLGCCLAPLLQSRLRAWDPRGKGGKIYKNGPVTSVKTDRCRRQFRVAKSQTPAQKHLCFL